MTVADAVPEQQTQLDPIEQQPVEPQPVPLESPTPIAEQERLLFNESMGKGAMDCFDESWWESGYYQAVLDDARYDWQGYQSFMVSQQRAIFPVFIA
jgi:hypothetical protein